MVTFTFVARPSIDTLRNLASNFELYIEDGTQVTPDNLDAIFDSQLNDVYQVWLTPEVPVSTASEYQFLNTPPKFDCLDDYHLFIGTGNYAFVDSSGDNLLVSQNGHLHLIVDPVPVAGPIVTTPGDSQELSIEFTGVTCYDNPNKAPSYLAKLMYSKLDLKPQPIGEYAMTLPIMSTDLKAKQSECRALRKPVEFEVIDMSSDVLSRESRMAKYLIERYMTFIDNPPEK